MSVDYKILVGNCLDTLKTLDDQSVNCCVTSPPYFNLRNYNNNEQIGLEESPKEFVNALVKVFREVKRILRDDGTLWLNLGDSYSGSGKGGNNKKWEHSQGIKSRVVYEGLKVKDLIGIPWLVAFALQKDGWYLRQDIIWNKPNAMPESVKDRCTKSHEYIFLLSKSAKYFYDYESIRENSVDPDGTRKRLETPVFAGPKHESGGYSGTGAKHTAGIKSFDGKRNKRSVWSVTTKSYNKAHFATYPPDLIKPCILAGCPEGGVVLDPFGGSGTTAEVALSLERNAILCELNKDYVDIIKHRLSSLQTSLNI